jgi:hypothetical protein
MGCEGAIDVDTIDPPETIPSEEPQPNFDLDPYVVVEPGPNSSEAEEEISHIVKPVIRPLRQPWRDC